MHATLGGNPAAAVIRAICFNKKVEELSLTQSKLGEGALKLLEANLLNKRVPSTLRSLNFRNSILEPKC